MVPAVDLFDDVPWPGGPDEGLRVVVGLGEIAGFEVMRMFKKGQFKGWIEEIVGGSEVSFINRLFGLYV